MRNTILILTIIISLKNKLYCQHEGIDWNGYLKKIHTADSLYKLADYKNSSRTFSDAFSYAQQGFMAGHRYLAARACTLSGQKDSALYNLDREIEFNFYDYKKLLAESAFITLHQTSQWDSIVVRAKLNYEIERNKSGRFAEVRFRLEEIHELDQQYRSEYFSAWQKTGRNSETTKELFKKMELQDSANLKEVLKILEAYGWIGYDSIGYKANQTFFLVIQHADIQTQQKYLPMLRKAVADNKAHGNQLALLEDRVLIGTGKKQLYGSQIDCDSTGSNCKLFPIEDEKNVDVRRASVGLEPLADYVRYWNIIYKKPE